MKIDQVNSGQKFVYRTGNDRTLREGVKGATLNDGQIVDCGGGSWQYANELDVIGVVPEAPAEPKASETGTGTDPQP